VSLDLCEKIHQDTTAEYLITRCLSGSCGAKQWLLDYHERGIFNLTPSCFYTTNLTTNFRDALGRRKEVLTELFYFTKHPDVPPDSESIIEQAVGESSDLKDFLAVNDLERLDPFNLIKSVGA